MTSRTMALMSGYRALVCDLDGVVYLGASAVPHAVESLTGLDVPIQYATNNASRPPASVAEHLGALGLSCADADVATSAQAGAGLLRDALAPGSVVLAVGGPGVGIALEEAGMRPVTPGDRAGHLDGVLQGYGAAVTASDLGEAAYAIQGGAIWVATNTDATLPTDRGVAPGNGSLVAAVQRACGRPPDLVAGKPEAPLYLLCAQRLGREPADVLAVGDRLDTDIEGAVAAGMDSLLVLTGVDDLRACATAPLRRRPTFVAPDLRALHEDPQAPRGSGESLHALWDAVSACWAARDSDSGDAHVARALAEAEDVLAGLRQR